MGDINEAVAYLRERLNDTDGGFLTDVEVGRGSLRTVVDWAEANIERLKALEALVKDVPFKVGDVVREVGEEEPTGEIIKISDVHGEQACLVKLYTEVPRYNGCASTKSITYYGDEIELIERKPNEG